MHDEQSTGADRRRRRAANLVFSFRLRAADGDSGTKRRNASEELSPLTNRLNAPASMRFEVLATDYDGTLAHHGRVNPSTVVALERLRASGRRALMVTGRELEELRSIFTRLDLFDTIVAENGALLHYPATGEIRLLHEAPPTRFTDALRATGIRPLSIGHVIVATEEPNEGVILHLIKQLGLELEIIFNKGSVMVLPTGVNKATGLACALRDLGSARTRLLLSVTRKTIMPFYNIVAVALRLPTRFPRSRSMPTSPRRNLTVPE